MRYLLVVLFTACAPNPTDTPVDAVTDSDPPTDPDADGDGVPASADCDDADPAVYPGAPDAWYDGVDADCAGNDDYDADGDGYAKNADDCDDDRRAIHPGATELRCDGVDNDCDGDPGATTVCDGVPFGEAPFAATFTAVIPDVTGDGRADLLTRYSDYATGHGGSDEVSFTVNAIGEDLVLSPLATLESHGSWSTTYFSYSGLNAVLPAGDVDGDGADDLWALPRDQDAVLVTGPITRDVDVDAAQTRLLTEEFAVLSLDRQGDGAVDAQVGARLCDGPLVGAISAGDCPLFGEKSEILRSAIAGDLDGDGVDDLAAALIIPGERVVLVDGPTGQISAAFDGEQDTLSGFRDVDGDGYADLLTAKSELKVFRGPLDRLKNLAHPETEIIGSKDRFVTVDAGADVDGDLASDAGMCVDGEGVGYVVHLGAEGRFAPEDVSYAVATEATVRMIDLEADGLVEVVAPTDWDNATLTYFDRGSWP